MKGSFLGPRLGRRDIGDLDAASEALKAVADVIQRANPTWTAAAINALITANDIVMRIHDKGARRIARYLEEHGAEMAQPDTDAGGPGDDTGQGGNALPGRS